MPGSKKNNSLYKQILPFSASKGDLRKIEIVRATIKCISQQGYENTNYETIGQIAGMKRPHVAYHFPNKDELILTAIRFVFATGQETVVDYLKQAEDSPDKQLQSYIEGTFAWLTQDKGFASVLALATYLGSVNSQYRKLATEFKRIGEERVRSIIERRKNILGKDVDILGEYVHTYILGRCIYWISCDVAKPAKDFIAETNRQILSLLNGERTKTPKKKKP